MEQQQPAESGVFDSTHPWGAYVPRGLAGVWLRVCQRVSGWRGCGRLAFWMRHPLKHRLSTPVDTAIWGLRMRLMPRGNLSESRMLFLPGLLDRTERRFLREHLKSGALFLDIGANAGAYSFWVFSCLRTKCIIHAVEPDPELRKRIAFNAATNAAASLQVIPDALSDSEGEMQLVLGKGNRGQNTLQESGDADNAITVRVRTLDALVRELNIRKIDALKIDIEGHEYRVMQHYFSNAARELWPTWIVCETVTEQQVQGMGRLLDSAGYRRVCSGKMNDVFELSRR